MKRVLVTRSEPGASETARRLEAMGLEPIVEPLFTIEPLDVAKPGDYDALAFTSANGVRAFAKIDPRRDAPVFCVGGRTAGVAKELGYQNVESADGDVDALAQLVAARLPKGASVLHAGNADTIGDLVGQLNTAGLTARFLPLFHAVPVTAPGESLAKHLRGEHAFDAVLIHSPRAAEILAQFASEATASVRLPVVAISENAADALAPPPSQNPWIAHGMTIVLAAHPDEDNILRALDHLLSQH